MIWALILYWVLGCMMALLVFTLEETPNYRPEGGGITDRPIGVVLTVLFWPVLLVILTVALLVPIGKVNR